MLIGLLMIGRHAPRGFYRSARVSRPRRNRLGPSWPTPGQDGQHTQLAKLAILANLAQNQLLTTTQTPAPVSAESPAAPDSRPQALRAELLLDLSAGGGKRIGQFLRQLAAGLGQVGL